MSFSKNAKRSITYQFQLTNSKLLPLTRYKGNTKLYQLNLSKMLLKCPDSPFLRKNQCVDNPEELVIVGADRANWGRGANETHDRNQLNGKEKRQQKEKNDLSLFAKTKAQIFKESIKQTLRNQDGFAFQSESQEKKLLNQDYNRTSQSPNSPYKKIQNKSNETKKTYDQTPQISASSSKKNLHHELIIVRQKKFYVSQIQNKKQLQKQILTIKSALKGQQIYQNSSQNPSNQLQIHKKNQKLPPHQFLKRAKNSKKLLLPELKPNAANPPHIPQPPMPLSHSFPSQPHAYNMASKSNIPLLFRSPDQLRQVKAQSYALLEYPSSSLVISNMGMNQYQIASLTKIMTFYTVMRIIQKFGLDKTEQVRVNENAMEMSGTSAEILAGQIYTVQQLLYGLMLPSGNDAAIALAQWGGKHLFKHHQPQQIIHSSLHISKTPDSQSHLHTSLTPKQKISLFVSQMNHHAKQLSLSSTRFANPHGLPHSDSKSTAIDVARLCAECLKDQFFRKVVGTLRYKFIPGETKEKQKSMGMEGKEKNEKGKRIVEWINTNKLLRRDGFIGIKTGITVTAGPCLASAYKFRDKIYIAVVLRATKVSRRFKDTRKILAWSLQKLYKQALTAQQLKTLAQLKKNKPDLDSDYSEDEQQFNYEQMSKAQIKKRSNIINYQM